MRTANTAHLMLRLTARILFYFFLFIDSYIHILKMDARFYDITLSAISEIFRQRVDTDNVCFSLHIQA